MCTLKVFENRAPNPRVKPTEIIQTFSWKSRWTMLDLYSYILGRKKIHVSMYLWLCLYCISYTHAFLKTFNGSLHNKLIHLKYSYLCKLVCSACEYHGYFWFVHRSFHFDNESKFWYITEANINTLFPVQVYICNHRSDLILKE